MSTVNDIADEVAAVLEPDPELRDDSRVRPRGGDEWEPGITYLWPVREQFVPDGTGQLDRRDFQLRMAWMAADTMARAGGAEDRAVSDLIADRVELVRARVAAARDGSTYEWLHVDAADYSLSALEVRGAYLDLSGYVLVI